MLSLRIFALLLVAAATVNAQEPVSLPLEPSDLGVLAPVEIDGRRVFLLVDTGARLTHLDAKFLKLSTAKQSLRVRTQAGTVEMSLVEDVELRLGRKWKVNIQTYNINLADLRVHCGCDLAGVLGVDVLRLFAVIEFDFRAAVLNLWEKRREKP